MPIFTINAGPGVEEILQMALHVNSAVFIYEKQARNLVIVPDSRTCSAMPRSTPSDGKTKTKKNSQGRTAVFAISIKRESRSRSTELFAKAINMRVKPSNAPVEAIGYTCQAQPFDGKIIWVQPGETQRLRDLIS